MLVLRPAIAVAAVLLLPSPTFATPPAAETFDCAPSGSSIRVSATASRLSGVAPLTVFFDARGTTADGIARPFHDLEYRWDFGDPAGGAWSNGSRPGVSSRNHATGAVSAHVFEKPGRFQVSLTVTQGAHTAKNDCLRVDVLDPDVYFGGQRTVCLSGDGNFEGCPQGAQEVVVPSRNFAHALRDYAAAGKRILFRRGETWHAPAPGILRSTGPGILGAFGTGARPKIAASADSEAPILQLSSPTSPGIKDWRVADLEFDGNGHAGRQAIKAEGGINQLSLLRLHMHGVRNGLMLSSHLLDWHNRNPRSAGHGLWDEIALVDSTTNNITGSRGGYSVYASAHRFMLLGNGLNNDGGGEHTVRLPSIVAGVISNNTMQGQGSAAGGKHAFTLRAAVHGSGGVEGGEDTRWVMVTDNKFVGSIGSDWTVTYQPQASADERIVDVVTERNWFVAGGGARGTQFALVLFARDQTIRNNLFDTSGGKAHGGIQVHDGLSVGSNLVNIFNNSFYSGDSGSDFVGITVRRGATDVTARNNLALAPRDSQARMIVGPATASHNSTDFQIRRSAPWQAAAMAASPSAWKPLKNSYAAETGMRVPVWSDFFGAPRPQHRLGAISP